jgi:hypothetical protein
MLGRIVMLAPAGVMDFSRLSAGLLAMVLLGLAICLGRSLVPVRNSKPPTRFPSKWD